MPRTEQILNAKFTPVSKGTYSAEEVDAFLRTVAASYEESLGENRELIKKISILADKIESYRNDEEAIKLALLDAHKMAENISKSATDKAEALVADAESKSKILLDGANRQTAQMIEEAREQAKNIVDNAREACDALTAKAQKDADEKLADAAQKAAGIIEGAEEEGRKIIGDSKESYEFFTAELEKVKAQTSKFKAAMEDLCKGQLSLIGNIPAEYIAAVNAAVTPAVEEIVDESIAEAESVAEISEEIVEEIADELPAIEEVVEEVVEEVSEEIPEVSEEVSEEPTEAETVEEPEIDLYSILDIPSDDVVDTAVEEDFNLPAAEPVKEEVEEAVSFDEDDLFSMIEDIKFEGSESADSLASSIDDLIPSIPVEEEKVVKDEEEFFGGFEIDLDAIDDIDFGEEDNSDNDDDIASLFDTMFDD